MTVSPLWFATALLALLVGAALPVLYQMYQTLRRARSLIETAGPRLERALDGLSQAADRVDRLGSSLEGPAQVLGPLLGAASRAGASIGRPAAWLRTATSVGAAVVPALIAGARAIFSTTDVQGETGDNGSGKQQPHVTE